MAPRNVDNWIPIPLDTTVNGTVPARSAVEALARYRAMTSDTLELPRLAGADVGGGPTLTEDTHDGSKITMYSYLFNGQQTFEETDIEDVSPDTLGAYGMEWQNQLVVSYDNASLGVTAARSTTATDHRPYTSMYRALATNDSDVGYVANANLDSGALTYGALNTVFGYVEDSRYWNEPNMAVIASTAYRALLRGILDKDDNPIFVEARAGTGGPDRLFNIPITWSNGAKTSTSFKMATVGNPLLFVVNTAYMVFGDRIRPQSRLIPPTTSLEVALQHRARKGFCLTIPQAAAGFEKTA